MKTLRTLLWLLAVVIAVTPALADDPRAEAEIHHLFEFVENSDCTFIRNGSEYPSVEARDHMEMKYGHVRKRVGSAEDMIRYIATRSSMTGRVYTVRCAGTEFPSAEWLTRELNDYRASGSADDSP